LVIGAINISKIWKKNGSYIYNANRPKLIK